MEIKSIEQGKKIDLQTLHRDINKKKTDTLPIAIHKNNEQYIRELKFLKNQVNELQERYLQEMNLLRNRIEKIERELGRNSSWLVDANGRIIKRNPHIM